MVSFRPCLTATRPTASSSRRWSGPRSHDRPRTEPDWHRRALRAGDGGPLVQRAVAADDPAARALPLRVLPAALPVDVVLPLLRRALDDHADERHRGSHLRALRRVDAEARVGRRALAPDRAHHLFGVALPRGLR